MIKNKKVRKEIRSWVVILTILGILYFTGWHRPVIGGLQSIVVKTGLIKPDIQGSENEQPEADYNFHLIAEDGQVINAQTLKGKVVFMNFWATWCPPCIAEMPDINDLYKEVASEDIVFLMISSDRQFEKAKLYKKKKEFSFPIYQMGSALPERFLTRSIPTTYVISPSGKIVVKHTGIAAYNTKEFKDFLLAMING
ncbi:TlpA disulfide reductase family protein [Fulvivirgaceae bacterium BMA10]|uniref:TlpA disulfide reductase family protein n=1 Tax=Splendidivirga corallicola TaxID=3051826 RepID=A0ABT8KKU7_9BACT|nr:TlpA disulfide reductase family protein [Fulvivirgaceae bacterium BMA10]